MDLFSGYLFYELEEDHLQQIAAFTSEIPMQSGDKLFSEGEKAEKIYILKEGAVELMSRVRSDFELPISMVRDPGDIFGASALILPHEYSLSAACAETGSVLRIERSSLMNLIVKDRDLGCIIMTNLAGYFLSRLKETRNELKIHFKVLLGSTRS